MPFFRFLDGSVFTYNELTFFQHFFVFKLCVLQKIRFARFQSFFPLAQLPKLTSGGPKEYLMSKKFWWDSGEILVGGVGGEIYDGPAWMGWHFFFRSLFCIQALRFWKDQMHTFLVLFSIRSTLKIDFRRSERRLGGQIGGHPPFWRGVFGQKRPKIQ